MKKNPFDSEIGRDVSGARVFHDTATGRLLRMIWETGSMPQADLMKRHYDIGDAAGKRNSKHKSSYQNSFGRLTMRGSWGRRSPYGGRMEVVQDDSKFDRPLLQETTTTPGRGNFNGAAGGKKSIVKWVGPTTDEWLAAMTEKELADAFQRMERQMTLRPEEDLNEKWVVRLNDEIQRRKRGGLHMHSDLRENPGEVENDESFAMSAGRFYAHQWTSLQYAETIGMPNDDMWTADLVGQIDIVSDTMKHERRGEAAGLVSDMSRDLPVEALWNTFRTMAWVLVGSGRIIHMWKGRENDGWGDIGIEVELQRWITNQYGGAYTFDSVSLEEQANMTLLHYRGNLDEMLAFADSKNFEPPSAEGRNVRRWTKKDERLRGGCSVWWWSNGIKEYFLEPDVVGSRTWRVNSRHTFEDFSIGFVMGLAQWLDKNASIYRKAPGMKQNPGERRDDESFDMKGGRFIAFDIHSNWSISLKQAQGRENDLSLVESILEPLAIASDTVERDPSAVDQAYDIIENTLAEVLELQELNDHAVEQWLGKKTVMAYNGRIVDVTPWAFRDEQSVKLSNLARTLPKPHRSNNIKGTDADGLYLLAESKRQPDALTADVYTMTFDEIVGASSNEPHKQFMLGYWMETLRVVRKMKNAKRRVNPSPLSDKEWWDGVLAKRRKQNPSDDASDDEIDMAVVEHGSTNREQRRRLLVLMEKAQRVINDMPHPSRRDFETQRRAEKIRGQIQAIKVKLEGHSNLVADLDGRRLNPAVDQNDVADREAAVKMYKTFWRMEPKSIGDFHEDFAIPSKVKEVGQGHSIMYRSLKTDPETLQKPKKAVDYIHHFDAGVHMYGPSSSGGVSVPSWITDVTSLTLLGSCLGWEIKVGGKMREAEGIAPLPELYTIPEGRALLIIQDKREVLAVFWGGDLGVEGRGIVH